MAELGARATKPASVYLTGGATAALFGWREATIDVDIRIEPDSDDVLRLLPSIKDALEINVKLASPADFIPELPGWRDRSLFIAQHGPLTFYNYDPYSQLLSKIERSHQQDRTDVDAMLRLGLVEPGRARELFESIEPLLYRIPPSTPFRSGARSMRVLLGRSSRSDGRTPSHCNGVDVRRRQSARRRLVAPQLSVALRESRAFDRLRAG